MAARIKKRFITEADEYVCPLSTEVQTMAEQELRETTVGREQALKALRDWAIQNPRIAAIRMGECDRKWKLTRYACLNSTFQLYLIVTLFLSEYLKTGSTKFYS